MPLSADTLWSEANVALRAGRPGDAMCYLAELVSAQPADRQARLALALALGDAGHRAGALKIMRLLAERLAHEGQLLAAMIVVRHGLEHAGDDPALRELLQRIHIRGVRAKAGSLAIPPPLRQTRAPAPSATALSLLQLDLAERWAKVTEIGFDLPPAGAAAMPVPMPLFCELETPAFIEVVRHLTYRRAAAGTHLLREGEPGDGIIVIASGAATVSKAGAVVARLGPGAVLGEMALITQAPRSATVTASEPVEYFELTRAEVFALARVQPKVAAELSAYCRGRLLQNLLRTSALFARFDEPTRVDILQHFKTTTFEAAETIVIQGQRSRGLFLIASGEVEVRIAGKDELVTVATLGPGEVFGEISLLEKQPATAFVVAKNTVGALVLAAEAFDQVLADHPGVRDYLQSLTAERLAASRQAVQVTGIDDDDVVVL